MPNNQDVSDIDSEEEISDDQTNASEVVSAGVSISTAPIPLFYDSNSSGDSSKIGLVNLLKAEVSTSFTTSSQINKSNKFRLPISILPDDPEEKRKHIIGLVLERFSYLFLSNSGEHIDRFNLNTSTLCPLCNGDSLNCGIPIVSIKA
ncbi:hypothetical protein RhiirA5_429066 [Rhizophagus irregularis]|uniref:Uncharacterized protein n=1 Tax=Rhizophagus irregularis TaxID=588596 RepID=A0A2N0NZ59_9GLOM|nr:hypothetical protein RhiirA5_429066 [Rhizophagus irregularis]